MKRFLLGYIVLCYSIAYGSQESTGRLAAKLQELESVVLSDGREIAQGYEVLRNHTYQIRKQKESTTLLINQRDANQKEVDQKLERQSSRIESLERKNNILSLSLGVTVLGGVVLYFRTRR